MAGNEENSAHRWQFFGAILTAIITTVGTVAVTYITVIKPGTRDVAEKEARRVVQENIQIDISANGGVRHNDSSKPAFIWGFCNATRQSKQIEVYSGENLSSLKLEQTVSGTGRISVSLIVPPKYYYNVIYDQVPGIGCSFSGWYL